MDAIRGYDRWLDRQLDEYLTDEEELEARKINEEKRQESKLDDYLSQR